MSEATKTEATKRYPLAGLAWLLPAFPGILIGSLGLAGLSYFLEADLTTFSFLVPIFGGLGYIVAALRNFRASNFSEVAKQWFLWLLFQAISGFLAVTLLVPKSLGWPILSGPAIFVAAALILTLFFRLFGWNKRAAPKADGSHSPKPNEEEDPDNTEESGLAGDKVVGKRLAMLWQQFLVKSGVTNVSQLTNQVVEAENLRQQKELLHEVNVSRQQALEELKFALQNKESYTDSQIKELLARAHRFDAQTQPPRAPITPRRFRASGGRHAPKR